MFNDDVKILYPRFTNFPKARDTQTEIINHVISSKKKYVMINAPCGIGKSYIGMTLGGILNNKCLYLCTTKLLQDQIAKDFPEAFIMKGRNNYPCTLIPELTAGDCGVKCGKYCRGEISCEYYRNKSRLMKEKYGVVNTSYYMSETNFAGKLSDYEDKYCVIVDEADTLESQLSDFISLEINPIDLKRWNINTPQYITKLDAWKQWAIDNAGYVGKMIDSLKWVEDIKDEERGEISDAIKEYNKYKSLAGKLLILSNCLDDNWLFQHADKFSFNPIWLQPKLSNRYFFDHAGKFILMSATFLPKPIQCALLGLSQDEVDYIEVDSPFPVENRKIYYEPIQKCGHGISESPIYAEIDRIINKYPHSKGIVHAVSYDRAQNIAKSNSRCITHSKHDKNDVIKTFIESDNLVLVSPSCERGLDLRDDLARFCIIPKVPFASLGDKKINMRLYSSSKKLGQMWYRSIAAQTIVQMAGRVVRHEQDKGDTYILDAKFSEVVEFCPKWFTDAIQI